MTSKTDLPPRHNFIYAIIGLAQLSVGLASLATAAEMRQRSVPLGGNSYLTSPATGSPDRVEPSGIKLWQNEKSVFSIYFRADRAAVLDLRLRLKVPEGESVIQASATGIVFEKKITGADIQDIALGKISVKTTGYVRVDLQGLRKTGQVFAEVSDLLVESSADMNLDFVKNPEENRFYWGRRGPSVHLVYELPPGKKSSIFTTR